MAIRFLCSACGQPIEADDEWASRPVACPYCQTTITAPSRTTLTDLSSIPKATPLTLETPGDSAGYPPAGTARIESPNHLAIVAAVLVVTATMLLFLYAGIMYAHADEFAVVLEHAEKLSQEGSSTLMATQRAWAEVYKDREGLPPDWMLAASATSIGMMLSWVGGLVCSVIACRRRRWRGLAIWALVFSCLLPLVFCGLTGAVLDPTSRPATSSTPHES